ncbi:MAG: YfcE family phosphodiesterase [Planctomycetes bacterium]|nr:YfcE family phosphodiesterase [Planctomycetota bacterium]
MVLGLLSDSHGDASATARAMALLAQHGAERFIHCGDICGEDVLAEFVGHDVTFVWGNCDSPSPSLRRYVQSVGLAWPEGRAELEIDGRRIAVFHGHERGFADAIESGHFHYVLHGHTHLYSDSLFNGCRVINPGALYRAAVKSVALLDVAADSVTFLRLDDGVVIPVGSRPK